MVCATARRPGARARRWGLFGLLAVAWLGTPERALAQAAASVEVEPAEVKLGEPAEVIIRIRGAASSARYQLPDKPDLGPFVELGRDAQIKQLADKRIQVLRLTVASFEQLGELTLPGMRLVAADQPAEASDGGLDGASGQAGAEGPPAEPLEIPPVQIKVLSLLAGVSEPSPKDVAAPLDILVPDHRLLVVAGLVVVWLGLGLLLRRNRPPEEVPSRLQELPPPRRAHEIALDRLQAIVDDDLLRQGRVHEYFTRISETLREYLGNRYGFFALDLTSAELTAELRDRITPGLDMEALTRGLGDADLVKFARLEPTDAMCSFAIDTAYAVVEATRLADEPDAGRA